MAGLTTITNFEYGRGRSKELDNALDEIKGGMASNAWHSMKSAERESILLRNGVVPAQADYWGSEYFWMKLPNHIMAAFVKGYKTAAKDSVKRPAPISSITPILTAKDKCKKCGGAPDEDTSAAWGKPICLACFKKAVGRDAIAKGSAAFGHEKQMTPSQYLVKCAKAALKDGESEAVFVQQFKEAYRETAKAAYRQALSAAKAKDAEAGSAKDSVVKFPRTTAKDAPLAQFQGMAV